MTMTLLSRTIRNNSLRTAYTGRNSRCCFKVFVLENSDFFSCKWNHQNNWLIRRSAKIIKILDSKIIFYFLIVQRNTFILLFTRTKSFWVKKLPDRLSYDLQTSGCLWSLCCLLRPYLLCRSPSVYPWCCPTSCRPTPTLSFEPMKKIKVTCISGFAINYLKIK